jgi:oligopeptide transport system substrate-binding protein
LISVHWPELKSLSELPAYGLVPDGIANYVSQKASWAGMSQADREAAAIKLMTEAGYGPRRPLNVRLAYVTSENNKRIVVATAAMWKKLGVNVELINTEQRVHYDNLRRKNFEIALTGGPPTITTRRISCFSGRPRPRRTSPRSPTRTMTG